MKLFKSKKPSTGITTSCISSKVGGKSNNSANYQDDKSETTSAASTPTTNGGLSQGDKDEMIYFLYDRWVYFPLIIAKVFTTLLFHLLFHSAMRPWALFVRIFASKIL